MCEADSAWQREDGRCGVALCEVFSWLEGAALARAGAVCRCWRRAAAEPALWRRLLLRDVSPQARRLLLATTDNSEWRSEYVCAHAGWRLHASAAAGGATLLHAALSPCQRRLALATADATVAVWERAPAWRERCRRELRAERGWASAARLHWAAAAPRLLVAGPRALADVASSWELLVLEFDEESGLRVVSRARCSGGAAGCWAGAAGDSFLSLLTSALAPAVACTAVWLNAATQETQSEYAGVTTRLLRVYNEDSANILHALVMELPWSALAAPPAAADVEYYRATRPPRVPQTPPAPDHHEDEWSQLRVLVLAWDGGRGGAGRGGLVSAWALGAPQPPALQAEAAGSLRARYLAHRERARAPPPEPPPPDEAGVRALCTAPEATCALPAAPVGLAPHPGERCVWVSTADTRALCVSVPALQVLRVLAPPGPPAPAPALYYAQPAASWHHVAACAGGGVCVWAALGAARPQLLGRHAAPAAAALLPRAAPRCMLVLAGDTFHEWRSRATPQSLPGWP